MYGYIYITKNLINEKQYIGQHKSNKFDDNYLGSGNLILLAIKKYGAENFKSKIIERCDSFNILNKKEIYHIQEYNAVNSDKFYNIANGGNSELTNEIKEKISKSRKGQKHSVETKKQISLSLKGKKKTEETKAKMSEAQKGKKLTEETKEKIRQSVGKYKCTDEAREKISKSKKGKKRKIIKCPHCSKEGGAGGMYLHHFNNCKSLI